MAKREFGTGSIYEADGIWHVAIYAGRRRIRRHRPDRESALEALAEILRLHAHELGYHYRLQAEGHRYRGLSRSRPPRAGVTVRVRWDVLERDGRRCVYCGASALTATLVVDHVQPVADGGSDDPSNLATACTECNAGKASRPLQTPLPARG